jgi:hypothetical protein
MPKRTWGFGAASLIMLLLIQHASYAQMPVVQLPKAFQIYYEVGPPVASLADTFDSEKNTRTVAAEKGMINYSAELTESEKSSIFAAIVQNDLLTVKDNFPKSSNFYIDPETAGRLRLTIDGKTKDIRFNLAYGCVPETSSSTGKVDDDDLLAYLVQHAQARDAQARGIPPCVTDPEWTRFNNVRRVIEAILKAKDDQQHVSHRMTP